MPQQLNCSVAGAAAWDRVDAAHAAEDNTWNRLMNWYDEAKADSAGERSRAQPQQHGNYLLLSR